MERCCTDDLMPNVPISCLPPSHVDPEVQGLKVIIDCPQPVSSLVTYRPPPLGRWSKCSGILTRWWSSLGAVSARCPKNLSLSDNYELRPTFQSFIDESCSLGYLGVMKRVYVRLRASRWRRRGADRGRCRHWNYANNNNNPGSHVVPKQA